MDSLYELLLALIKVGEAEKRAHVANIHERYIDKNIATLPSACLRSGAELVQRTAKKGPNAVSQFYGCTNYPKCRYTRSA